MENEDLMAAVGKVVVDAAALEYSVAVLVATTEGHQDQDCEDRALALVKDVGRAMRELKNLASAHLERPGLMGLWRDVRAVLNGRNVIVHAIPLEDVRVGAQGGLISWHARTGKEARLTTSAVLSLAQDIRIAYRRVHDAIATESSAEPVAG
jgi:hypothetical protein